MPDQNTIEITFTAEELALLADGMKTGGYRTPSGFIQNALWEWHIAHGLHSEEMNHLRALAEQGETSGIAEPFTFGELREEARAATRLRRPKSAEWLL